jgi:hypothetical protein
MPKALQTETVTYKLSVGRKVKMKIPHELLALFREGQNRKEAAVKK